MLSIHMVTRTITITDTAYKLLASHKYQGDSFSDVIVKTLGGSSLLEIVGIFSPEEAEDLRARVKERRKAMRRRVEDVARRV